MLNQISHISEEAKLLLTADKYKNIARNVTRIKNPAKNGAPKNFDELSMEDLQKITDDNGIPLVRSLIKNPSNMLVIGTDVNMQRLSNCSIWSIDCTFKVSLFGSRAFHIYSVLL